MSSFLIVSFSLLSYSCQSVPCVPANTCFEIKRHPNSNYQRSIRFTCSGGRVTQHLYSGLTCEGAHTNSETTEIYGGDIVQNSSSGSIVSDYLQGVGCIKLTSPSEQCQDFMVLKHRGLRSDPDPFSDIGNNCTNYLGNEANFVQYSMVYMPVGCVNQFVGSQLYQCDENGWDYIKYEDKDCQGNILSAHTKNLKVDTCGYFSEWWYWYDLICCPIAGKTCCGAPSTGPTVIKEECVLTPQPTFNPIQPTTAPTTQPPTKAPTTQPPTKAPTTQPPTKAPTSATDTPTKKPTTPGTSKPTTPTTAAPTDIFGTAKPTAPTTQAPTTPGTAKPTTPGTSKPTAPTTAAPTDIFGTAKPTAPTTQAPTTHGTAKPTKNPTLLSTAQPTTQPATANPTTQSSTNTIQMTTTDDEFEPCIDEYIHFSDAVKIMIKIDINKKLKMMNITLEGPNDKWFGVGFGSDKMANTYAITLFGTVEKIKERKLGHHSQGIEIADSFNSINYITLSTRRIVTLIMDYKINGNSDAFDFTEFFECDTNELNVISAIGRELPFGYHVETMSAIFQSCCNITETNAPMSTPTAKPTDDIFGNAGLSLSFMYSVFIGTIITILVSVW